MEDAKGIPERGKKGKIPKDHTSKWKLNVQEHKADKAGKHYDIRLNPPGSDKAYSWAARHFPGPGEKTTAVQTDLHSKGYLGFSGEIKSGYGKGKVDSLTLEDVEILKSDDDHVKFNRYKGSDTERYIMMRKPGTDEFLFYNYTPTESSKIYQDVPKYKEKYKNVPLDKLDPQIRSDKEVWSPKLDGAHNLVVLRGGKNPDVFSYRKSRKEGDKFIDHTYRTKIYDQRVPKEFKKTILRGELFVPGKRGNETAGILNSNVWKAREKGPLDLNVFDVVKWKGKNVEDKTFAEKLQMLQEVQDKIPGLKHTPWATTEKEKQTLRRQMLNKENPLTEEGLAIYDLDSSTPRKSKQEDDWDGEIVGTFEATPGSKYEGSAIGGFLVRPEGSDKILRVGSGLDDATRREAFQNPDKFKGEWAKFKSQHVHASGKHQAPIFKEMRADKFYRPNEKTASKKIREAIKDGIIWGGSGLTAGALSAKLTKSKKLLPLSLIQGGAAGLAGAVSALSKNKNLTKTKTASKMKNTKKLEKNAFQGYISSQKGLKKKDEKAFKNRGYNKVSPDEYVDLKFKKIKGKVDEAETKIKASGDKDPTKGTLFGGSLAGLASLTASGATKGFSPLKAGLVAAGTLAGAGLGYAGGRAIKKKKYEKADKVQKIISEKEEQMRDVYNIQGERGNQFYVKKAGLSHLTKEANASLNEVIDRAADNEISKVRKESLKNIAGSGASMAAFSGAVDLIGSKTGLLANGGLKRSLGLAGLFGGLSSGLQAVREVGPYRRKVNAIKKLRDNAKQNAILYRGQNQ